MTILSEINFVGGNVRNIATFETLVFWRKFGDFSMHSFPSSPHAEFLRGLYCQHLSRVIHKQILLQIDDCDTTPDLHFLGEKESKEARKQHGFTSFFFIPICISLKVSAFFSTSEFSQ